jgi:hypothetical protein
MGPAELVAGKRVDAYPALWWQWVNRKRWGAQAFQDPSGAQCALNQVGPVWFLAGTDGTDAIKRHCRVPTGKHVFLPLITMLANSIVGRERDCTRLKAEAAANNGHLVTTGVRIDGVPVDVPALRMGSACFNAYAQADYLKDQKHDRLSATDGYWLMLAPFADGPHTIEVHVGYDNPGVSLGDLEQEFEYALDVGGPEPAPADEDAEDQEDHETDDAPGQNWLKT